MLYTPIKPMLLYKADTPPEGDWLHQMKWDGHRAILHYKKNMGVRNLDS